MKEKIFSTYVPLYDMALKLVITISVDASVQKRGFPGAVDYEAVSLRYKGHNYIVLTKDATAGTIAHESIHAAADILQRVGVRFGASNQEPLSYLAGWIADWVARKLKKR